MMMQLQLSQLNYLQPCWEVKQKQLQVISRQDRSTGLACRTSVKKCRSTRLVISNRGKVNHVDLQAFRWEGRSTRLDWLREKGRQVDQGNDLPACRPTLASRLIYASSYMYSTFLSEAKQNRTKIQRYHPTPFAWQTRKRRSEGTDHTSEGRRRVCRDMLFISKNL